MTAEKKQRQVVISRSAANGIISYSKALHPNEAILILQGKTTSKQVIIEGLVIPPFALSGPYYSGYSNFYLPSDSSYVGSAHSHPGGSNRPSLEDLNRGFYGAVSIIIAHPYEDRTMAVYDRNGNKLDFEITNSS
ncbi:MAG TPA: Mov34/MPN/PAD-1 family protein [Nitrososphaeraceae archaeon]|nr:Mov34/MPN/PAD-1 family protein [Nitrososphaeraceae archaeon]